MGTDVGGNGNMKGIAKKVGTEKHWSSTLMLECFHLHVYVALYTIKAQTKTTSNGEP